MKKTAISIALLVTVGLPVIHYGQTTTTGTSIKKGNQVPIAKVFEKLSKATNTSFLYSSSDFKGIFADESAINYSSLEQALSYLKSHYPVEYEKRNNTVVLRKTASKNITRKEILPSVKTDTASTKEKKIDEVVLIGYGTQKKKDVSGSIASIGSKDLTGVATSNFGEMIVGKAPGVQVTQSNATPGSSPTIRIRGIGTLTAGVNPLIVVDGFPLSEGSDINSIDPASIESIDILKDAASSAIYGSRGANGVVLIQTKQGKKGRTEVSVDSYYGIQSVASNNKVVDAYQMAVFMKESRDNNYLSKGTNRSINDDTATRKAKGASLRELIPDYLTPYLNGAPGLTNNNWYKTIFRDAPVSNTTFNVNGGTDKSRYSFTGSYFNQKGIVIGTDYEKYSSNINLSTDLSDNLKIGVSVTPSYSSGNIFDMVDGGRTYNVVQMASTMYPFFAPRDANGNLLISQQIKANTPTDAALVENPVAIAEMTKRKYSNLRIFGDVFAELKILKDFKYKISVGGDYTSYEYNFFDPSTVGSYRTPAPDVTSASRTDYIRKNYLLENLLTYNKRINEHSFSALAGQSFQKENYNEVRTVAGSFPDNSITNIAGGTSFNVNVNEYKWTLLSYFGRISYSYANRYSIMGSYRRDGSSRFGDNSKWGDFYAFSLAWSLSNEDFFPKNKFIDPVKLRFSVGNNGNNQIPNFGAKSLMRKENYVFGGILAPGYRAFTAPNPDISWEKAKSTNFGIDFSLFNKYLNVSGDYYILNRTGLLLDVPVPEQTGYSTSLQNIGEVRNTGLELQLSLKPLHIGKDFEYNSSFNFSTNKNKVLALANGQSQIITGANNFSITKVGGSIGEMYGYNILGVYKNLEQINSTPHITGTLVGDYIMEDLNGDGIIDERDKKSFGSGVPKYILGLTNNFKYKNFELNFTLYSELGKRVYNGDMVSIGEAGEGFGVPSQYYFDNRYNPETNPNGFFAMPNMNFSNNRKEARTSSIFFKKADYLRLRSVRLAYNVPQEILSALNIRAIQLYVMGNNLFTITPYKGQNIDATTDNVLTQGYDNGYYPVSRSVSLGVSMKF
ncbi:SusC/RagA family TonB-linked outer membrane protein [Elizabethkingia meningoseptica]|uniref:SusC/RagA family TonB-linked outer membrane protein n=1 Tax=Elizabethkingia meningoseptica TaxID=238 RepID=UPI003892956F